MADRNESQEKIAHPFLYFGGKANYVAETLKWFPPHKILVDGCGGSGCVTFNAWRAKTSQIYVYNDLAYNSVFMRILRDRPDELMHYLDYVLYSKHDLRFAQKNWRSEKNDVIRAALWFVAVQMSYEHSERPTGFKTSVSNDEGSYFRGYVERLPQFARMLKYITIEDKDILKLIADYDKSVDADKILYYLDPPYMNETRVARDVYSYEMGYEQHADLLRMASKVKGSAIIAGYNSSLYDALLRPDNGWVKREYSHENKGNVNSVGQKTEVLYVRSNQKGLWDK